MKKTKKTLFIAFGLLALALIVAACSGDDDTSSGSDTGSEEAVVINVSLNEFMVGLDTTDVPTGVPVTFNITNDGAIEHEFVLEADGGDREPLAAGTLVEGIGSGDTASVTFTFEEGGTFQLACHIPGHFEAGMTNSISVGG